MSPIPAKQSIIDCRGASAIISTDAKLFTVTLFSQMYLIILNDSATRRKPGPYRQSIIECRDPSTIISADAELFAPLSCSVGCILIILNELATGSKPGPYHVADL